MAVRLRRLGSSATLLLCGLTLCPSTAVAQDDTIGSDGYVHVAPDGTVVGVDPYYPKDGNGGYDVTDYDVALTYNPLTRLIDARTTVSAVTTQRLSRFDLDLRGLSVWRVAVDGVPAAFSRAGEHELVITPATILPAGKEFTVEVAYRGRPTPEQTPRGLTGWRTSRTGGAFAAGAPHPASTWFPVDETTADKATLHVTATVPAGWTAVANGVRTSVHTGQSTTVKWAENTPIAPGATMIAIDRLTVRESTLPSGTPVVDAFAPGASTALAAALPGVVTAMADRLGPFPYPTTGGVYLADRLGQDHPAQGRPVLGADADQQALAHAIAAQWWGNRLSIKLWRDQPMVESFARYLVWLWDEERGGVPVDRRYQDAMRCAGDDPAFWGRVLADPGRGNEFAVTDKGVLMVHALRKLLGDDRFFAVLRGFPEVNDNWNQGWHDWELYTAAVADRDLTGFYDAWVHGRTLPPAQYR
ncbi:M1 family metallopeptidase [Actinosynnema sp. NPDC020468]|uniref:M1 family metallopeptidase n=1 Tax=Actinosynnema sp. NPDC020468 TaxID=3154488 RepID=UPI0033FFAE14